MTVALIIASLWLDEIVISAAYLRCCYLEKQLYYKTLLVVWWCDCYLLAAFLPWLSISCFLHSIPSMASVGASIRLGRVPDGSWCDAVSNPLSWPGPFTDSPSEPCAQTWTSQRPGLRFHRDVNVTQRTEMSCVMDSKRRCDEQHDAACTSFANFPWIRVSCVLWLLLYTRGRAPCTCLI